MRKSTVISLGIAAVIAAASAVGVRVIMDVEREAAFQEAQTAVIEETSTIVVAATQIKRGEVLGVNNLEVIEWKAKEVPSTFFESLEELELNPEEPRHAIISFEAGEPIHENQVTDPGKMAKLSASLAPDHKAVSIRVNDVVGVAGFVLPGDHVDVLLTRRFNDEAFVDVLLQGVKVLAVDQLADARTDAPAVVRTVTFEVTTEEAQKLTLGANIGTISLALRNISDQEAEPSTRISLETLEEAQEAQGAAAQGVQEAAPLAVGEVVEDLPETEVVKAQKPALIAGKDTASADLTELAEAEIPSFGEGAEVYVPESQEQIVPEVEEQIDYSPEIHAMVSEEVDAMSPSAGTETPILNIEVSEIGVGSDTEIGFAESLMQFGSPVQYDTVPSVETVSLATLLMEEMPYVQLTTPYTQPVTQTVTIIRGLGRQEEYKVPQFIPTSP